MKQTKKVLAIILAMVLSISMLPAANVNAAAKKVKLNKQKVTIYVGKTVQLKLKNNKKKVKWISSNKRVATVSKKGKVKGKKAGKATITAKVGKKKYKCKVAVKKKVVKTSSGGNPSVNTTTNTSSGGNPSVNTTTNTSSSSNPSVNTSTTTTLPAGYATLKNYILTKGSVNSNGDRIIQMHIEEGNGDSGIIYVSNEKKFQFIYRTCISDSAEYSVMMTVYEKDTGVGEIIIAISDDVATYMNVYGEATLKLLNYYDKQSLNFSKFLPASSLMTEEMGTKLLQSGFELAVVGWNLLLTEKTYLSISNLGFANYSIPGDSSNIPSETPTTKPAETPTTKPEEPTTPGNIEPAGPDYTEAAGSEALKSARYLAGEVGANQYKAVLGKGVVNEIVSIQKFGAATDYGIYVAFFDANFGEMTVNGKPLNVMIDGAGIIMYLSNFEYMYNDVVINSGDGSQKAVIYVYNAQGIDNSDKGL